MNIDMKLRDLNTLLALTLASALTFTSCDKADDIIHSLDKLNYQAYLHNESGQDVMVVMRPRAWNDDDHTYYVRKDAVVEIPDTELWGLEQRVTDSDSVVFQFADGRRVVHSFTNPNYGQGKDTYLYSPADNNIFSVGFEVPDDQESWVRSKIRPQKYRFDYTIR